MEKIVVLTGETEHDETLIKCLRMLFPECEIEIQSKQPDITNDQPSTEDPENLDSLDEKLNKYMRFL